MPMVVTDPRQPDNPIVLANKAFLDLTGYTADEVLGRNCRILQGEGTAPEAVEAMRKGLAEEHDTDVEILNYRKDGTAFWNQLSFTPVHDESGKLLYWFGSQIDVTELRKVQMLEASEHRLLREVDHRALNVLAAVNGIVRLSRSEDAARYAKAIQDRVHALADAHTLLARRGWQETPLSEIVAQQLAGADPARVTFSGPELRVPAIAVQPLALVMRELLDNAKTHGALSSAAGTVEVGWEAKPSNAFVLSWRERGGPERPRDGSPGFGSAMIKSMIDGQLRGHVSREWGDGELTIVLSIPGS